MRSPHHLFVFGKGRIERGKAAALVVMEYFFIGMLVGSAGRNQKAKGKIQKKSAVFI
jgi:hypothetical protein